MDLLSQLAGTAVLRPYFVAFLCVYFVACTLHLGAARALAFAVVGFLIAWISEVSSIHNGVPYGYYYYVEDTRGRELWCAGVPFMDSMSFVFLSYAAFSMALMVVTPAVRNGGIYLLETNRVRHSFKVRLLGALFFMYLDIIIDPVALQGHRWFLGRIYGYPGGGAYFGVPIWNFAGWFIVGFVLIWALQLIDRLMLKLRISAFMPSHRYRYMIGPALYAGIICFNLCITLLIGDYHLLWAGIFIMLLPAGLIAVQWTTRQTTAEAVDDHLRDFPQPEPIRKMIGAHAAALQ
jgi:putative membrane protein